MRSNILNWYFTPSRFFEKSGTLYRFLGVHIFKKFLPAGDIVLYLKKSRRINGTTETLKEYEKWTRVVEAIHLVLLAIYTLFLIIDFTWLFFSANLLINVYPIMVQRYNRGRVCRILQKKEVAKVKFAN